MSSLLGRPKISPIPRRKNIPTTDFTTWPRCQAAAHRCALACVVFVGLIFTAGHILAETLYVNVSNATPLAPYAGWATAATRIQDAVDAAQDGDTVWVTNGIYALGGALVSDSPLVNRVAITNAIHVRSVNGAAFTSIVGRGPRGTNAVRCAFVGKNASLSGFTLTNGHTRVDWVTDYDSNGGGVMCEGNAQVTDCLITGNRAYLGGGVYDGHIRNCRVRDNSAHEGGGVNGSHVRNSWIGANTAESGGGAWLFWSGSLDACTVLDNHATLRGGGVYGGSATNCIVYYNTADVDGPNAFGMTADFTCTVPALMGIANLSTPPGLLRPGTPDLAGHSPCLNRGTNLAWMAGARDLGGDVRVLDSQVDLGCDEFEAQAATGALVVAASSVATHVVVNAPLRFRGDIRGNAQGYRWVWGDGQIGPNTIITTHTYATPGQYAVILEAWNQTHQAAVTVRVDVVAGYTNYVVQAGSQPQWPYTHWSTAATNIQDAIAANAVIGGVVLVSNGVYATGSRIWAGSPSRVAVTNALVVQSVNGPEATVIVGDRDHDIRCVYLGRGAALMGFTLTNGAAGDDPELGKGGGVLCAADARVSNCVITDCTANQGGGACFGLIRDCRIVGNAAGTGGGTFAGQIWNSTLSHNTAWSGGGACFGTLRNCAISRNTASMGGGASWSTLLNVTLTGNSADESGGGAYQSELENCVVYYNQAIVTGANLDRDSHAVYCCTIPAVEGMGNVTNTPGLHGLDNPRLTVLSACIDRGRSRSWMTTATDFDGEPRIQGPAVDIGCDELHVGGATGHVSMVVHLPYPSVVAGWPVPVEARIQGQVERYIWDWGDGHTSPGVPLAEHAYANTGRYAIVLTAWTANATVTATGVVQIIGGYTNYVAQSGNTPLSPFTSWATAARQIQHAVDVNPVPGGVVLVGNGVYSNGWTAVPAEGYARSRVAVTNPVTVRSAGGPQAAFITGEAPDVRGVYLGPNAHLSGFTVTNGWSERGGGVCFGGNASVSNCVIAGNTAFNGGGGTCGGTIVDTTIVGNTAIVGGGSDGGILRNCLVLQNVASAGGGGIHGSRVTACTITGNRSNDEGGGALHGIAEGCTINGNVAGWAGGGAFDSVLRDCQVYGNSAGTIGGGLYQCTAEDSVIRTNTTASGGGAARSELRRCTLVNNLATFSGGGASASTLFNCHVEGNQAGHNGGGTLESTVRSSLIVGNHAGYDGGGSYEGTLLNCTLSNNEAVSCGGGAYQIVARNCIVYYNTAGSTGDNLELPFDITYTCTTPDPGGTNNTTTSPGFENRAGHDYRVRATSPCVDAGIREDWMQDALDLAGAPRVRNGAVDMGAHEFAFTADLRAFLEGPYSTNLHEMATSPMLSHVPSAAPYSADPQKATAIPSNTVDWVLLEVRDTDHQIHAVASALLRSDGVMLSAGGGTGVVVEVSTGMYHLVLKHRNHLSVASLDPIAFTNRNVAFDFAHDAMALIGGANSCVMLETGVWGLRAGDADGDGRVTQTDWLIVSNQFEQTGYLSGDLNLDGKVTKRDINAAKSRGR